MSTSPTPDEMEPLLRRMFEENYELLRAESGRSLSPDVRDAAWQQVRLYWLKLGDVARRISATEVKLNLPGQTTPQGRSFGIEGIVDIVQQQGRTTMYDIKTHDPATIRGNLSLYEEQLNIYAHIWCRLRGETLDETAVISTGLPHELLEALQSGNAGRLALELERWNPIVPVPFSTSRVAETIRSFGEVVDAIENGAFEPPPPAQLQSRLPGMRANFATQVCVNCDARHSCSAYRSYSGQQLRRAAETRATYQVDSELSDIELTDRIVAGLDAAPLPVELEDVG